MNKKIGIGIVGLILIFGFYIFSNNTEIVNYPSSGNGIIAFGDSLVAGVGSTDGNDFVSRLSRGVGQQILNLGVPGNTTRDGLARITEVTQYNPEVVLLLLGGNDALRRISKEETEANLRSLIVQIQDTGAVVVLLGVRGGLLGDGYKSMYENLSDELGTAYVEDVLKGLFGKPQFMSDAIHPNDAGYAKVAERILPVLQSVIQ